MTSCQFHPDHENRISRLEDEMKEVRSRQTNPALLIGVLSFIGTIVSAVGSAFSMILIAYLRSRGYL